MFNGGFAHVTTTVSLYLVMLAVIGACFPALRRRLALSRAKHRSLAGHGRIAKYLAACLRGYAYDDARFFASDNAPSDVINARRQGFARLATMLARRSPQTIAMAGEASNAISDLQFIGAYRVPFQYSTYLRRHLPMGGFLQASDGFEVCDLDGNRYYDLTGSYGVNVFGYEFYKQCIREGTERVEALGPVLGAYHPCVADNVQDLQRVSGLDEVSFHMSGTEAVMQAVRLARYHTGRKRIVRFCGAYHGWWEDVQPGPGSPIQPRHTLTLEELAPAALRVLSQRGDIACVLVNPLQALHPNQPAPGDGTLIDSSRQAHFDRDRYRAWLEKLREICSARGIVLIFDEVFVGFRLALGGAQAYFGVSADMVTYGKTVAGGLPIGVLCGRGPLMKRYRQDRPADICFARGTFNAHPYVMGAMRVFFERLAEPATQRLYIDLDETWDRRAGELNRLLEQSDLPVRVANLSSIWIVCYTRPSRYNWMLQFYLREAGLALSWVGSGRLIFSLDYTDAAFAEVAVRFVRAAQAMQRDGWWWHDPALTDRAIRRQVLREAMTQRF